MGAFFYKISYLLYRWCWAWAALAAILFVLFCGWTISSVVHDLAAPIIDPQVAADKQLNQILNEQSPKELIKVSRGADTYTYRCLKPYWHHHIRVVNFSDAIGRGYHYGNLGRYKGAHIQMRHLSGSQYKLLRIKISPNAD